MARYPTDDEGQPIPMDFTFPEDRRQKNVCYYCGRSTEEGLGFVVRTMSAQIYPTDTPVNLAQQLERHRIGSCCQRRFPQPYRWPLVPDVPGMINDNPAILTPFADNGWQGWLGGPPAHPGPTADQLAEADRLDNEAKASLAAREESFHRCDTDGFVSQWAHQMTARLALREAQILRVGGFARFPGLFRRATGAREPAKLLRREQGHIVSHYWAFLDDSNRFTGRFLNDARTTRGRLFHEGFVVLGEWAPATAKLKGSGTGLSGAASAYVATVRNDRF